MEDFLRNVEKTTDGCWLWKGPTCGSGRYGRVLGKSPFDMAHRFSYQLFNGIDPGKNLVCHHCDNGLCVNPGHLFLGSVRDNTLDMVKKGRARGLFTKDQKQAGECNANAKLCRTQVEEIRKFQADNNYSYGQLAKRFGLRSRGHAHAIVIGKIWK